MPSLKRTKTVKKNKKKKNKPRTAKKLKDIVITSPVEPSAQLIVASELADDSIIESELSGEALPYYIYQFKQGGETITGLSVKGVNETVRRLNRDRKSGYKIRINPNQLHIERDVEQDGEKGVSVSVFAENLVDGNSAWGTKFEPYKKSGRNGGYTNTFAVEKALSKAERNAKRKLIPETMVIKMIEKMLKEYPNGVKLLAPVENEGRVVSPKSPMPSSPEELEQLIRNRIKETKDMEVVVEIDRKTQASKNFSKAFKSEVRKLAAKRIDEISKQKNEN